MQSIQKVIKTLKMQLYLSQYELAEKLGMTAPSICKYENGTRTPTFRTIRKIIAFAKSQGIELTYKDFVDDQPDNT